MYEMFRPGGMFAGSKYGVSCEGGGGGEERERGGDARVYLIVDDFNHPASGTNQMNRWNVKVYLISKSRYLPRSKCNFEWNAGFEPPPPFLNPFLARLASSTRFHMHS